MLLRVPEWFSLLTPDFSPGSNLRAVKSSPVSATTNPPTPPHPPTWPVHTLKLSLSLSLKKKKKCSVTPIFFQYFVFQMYLLTKSKHPIHPINFYDL